MGQSSLKQSTARLQAYLERRRPAQCVVQATAEIASYDAPLLARQETPATHIPDAPPTQVNSGALLSPLRDDQVLMMPGPAGSSVLDEKLNDLDRQPKEKRCSHRKTTALAGIIHNKGKTQGIACRIVDMSATGARVKLRLLAGTGLCAPTITDDFQLFLTYDRMSVPCSVEWRDGEHIGAHFTLAPQFY